MDMPPTRYGSVEMPDVKVAKGSTAILQTDWRVEGMLPDGRIFYIEVKAGFVFDGASIPRALWRLCGHPLEAPRIAAALAHDWIYASRACDRADADAIYREICRLVGIPFLCRNVEYWTLRAFGWIAWHSHTIDERCFALTHGARELEPKKENQK